MQRGKNTFLGYRDSYPGTIIIGSNFRYYFYKRAASHISYTGFHSDDIVAMPYSVDYRTGECFFD